MLIKKTRTNLTRCLKTNGTSTHKNAVATAISNDEYKVLKGYNTICARNEWTTTEGFSTIE